MKTRVVIRSLLALPVLLIGLPQEAGAENPCIPLNISTADPAPCVFGDTLYLYNTQDNDASLAITNLRCWSTTDLVNWKSWGIILSESNVAWSNKAGHLWAPHVVHFGGKYHLYFPETNSNGTFYIGHATCASPHGVFTADVNSMVINGARTGTVQDAGLDPFVIMDTGAGASGKNYLAWCITGITPNRNYIGTLNRAGDSVIGAPTQLTNSQFYPDGGHYVEGEWWIKPASTWYHIYACYYPGGAEQIGVATATNLTGPYTWRGWLMGSNINSAAGTIHPGCALYKGKWLLFWHCGGEEFGGSLVTGSALRSTGCEYFQFNTANPPAIVSPITPAIAWSIPKTYRGVGIPRALDTIQVDRVSNTDTTNRAIIGASVADVDGGEPLGHMITTIGNNGWARYDSVDFTGCDSVIARYASTNAANAMEIRTGSNTGTLIATVPLPSTNGLTTWATTPTIKLTTDTIGIKNLVVVFKGTANTMKLNWIRFYPQAVGTMREGKGPASRFACVRLKRNMFRITLEPGFAGPQISLVNVQGRNVVALRQKWVGPNTILVSFDSARLPAGIYLLTSRTASGSRNFRFEL